MNHALRISLIVASLCFESCNNDFNINAPHEDVYVLNCILRNDSPIQYALISKNLYTQNGTAPPLNTIDRNITGLDVKIYRDDSAFVMRDTIIQLSDSGNETRIGCYYVKDLVLSPGKAVSIEAQAPGGKVLKSTVQVPNISYSSFSPTFPQAYQPGYQTRPNYGWSWITAAGSNTAILSLPQLEITYKKNEGGTMIEKKALVPLAFYFTFDRNWNLVPVEVKLSFNTYCIATLDAVNKTVQEISGDDPHKNNYTITKVLFTVMSLDPELSKYYSANNIYSEDFTVKLRQTDFSNIEGGKGIFGVYYNFSRRLVVDSVYVQSFGYRYGPS
jgi:hypothetical protein